MNLVDELLERIKSNATELELINAAKYLNMSYTLYTTDEILWNSIKGVFRKELHSIIDEYSNKFVANRLIDKLIFKYYPCERAIKYALVDQLKEKHDTVLFEMPILNSRVDVCRINGKSYAYEIKTEYDSYHRLEKQLEDYSKVFEYVYVVVPLSEYDNVSNLIQNHIGIKTYKHNKDEGSIILSNRKKAIKSPYIDTRAQLSCLTKEQIRKLIVSKKIKSIPFSKEERIDCLLNKYSKVTINFDFKKIVKKLYQKNWEFILSNYDEIIPIDLQAFFSSSIDPQILYYKE